MHKYSGSGRETYIEYAMVNATEMKCSCPIGLGSDTDFFRIYKDAYVDEKWSSSNVVDPELYTSEKYVEDMNDN